MPFRFRKSIRLGKRTRLNFSKRGVSTSVRLPGGITWSSASGSRTRKKAQPRGGAAVKKKGISTKAWKGIGIFLGVVVLIEVVGAVLFGGDPEEVPTDPAEDAGIERAITDEESAPLVLYDDPEPEPEPEPEPVYEPEPVDSWYLSTDPAYEPEPAQEWYPEPESAITLSYLTTPISNNEFATLSVIGKPWTEYRISVYYSTRRSEAQGLENKWSDENGYVEWTWKVGANTTPGDHKITVDGGGDTFETYFTTYE